MMSDEKQSSEQTARFVADASTTGLAVLDAREAANRMTSGDLSGLPAAAPLASREELRSGTLAAHATDRYFSSNQKAQQP